MTTVVATITTKKQTVSSTSPASNNIVFRLMQGTLQKDSKSVALPGLTTTFFAVADGDYTITAQRLNSLNQPIGDMARSDVFTANNSAEIDVPETVTVTLS